MAQTSVLNSGLPEQLEGHERPFLERTFPELWRYAGCVAMLHRAYVAYKRGDAPIAGQFLSDSLGRF